MSETNGRIGPLHVHWANTITTGNVLSALAAMFGAGVIWATLNAQITDNVESIQDAEDRMEAMDGRDDGQDGRISALSERMVTLGDTVVHLSATDQTRADHGDRITRLESGLSNLDGDLDEIKTMLRDMQRWQEGRVRPQPDSND